MFLVCVCILTLVTRHAKRICRIISSAVACPALQYFYTLSRKQHDIAKKVIEYKMHVLIFSTTFSETILNLRIIQRDSIINVHRSSCKVPLILVRF
jgi:hypothetical protein